jgi:uncharacterized protein with PIN domain
MTPNSPNNVTIEAKKCPVCNWQLRKVMEPLTDARFSLQYGGLVQDFRTMWECPICERLFEFDEQDDLETIPY